MRRSTKHLLYRVFDTLGAKRVERGLRATGHQWSDCFLSHALAGQGLKADTPLSLQAIGRFYAPLLGYAPGMVYEVARLWDRDETGFRAAAQEWLDRDQGAAEAPKAVVMNQPSLWKRLFGQPRRSTNSSRRTSRS